MIWPSARYNSPSRRNLEYPVASQQAFKASISVVVRWLMLQAQQEALALRFVLPELNLKLGKGTTPFNPAMTP